jgi:hypothetical protein
VTLGKRQRETLDGYARTLIDDPTGYRVEVQILPWRRFTREAGGGSGYPIVVKGFTFEDGKEHPMEGRWLSTCTEDYTAVEKGQEIARYLVAAGCPKDRIRVRRESL